MRNLEINAEKLRDAYGSTGKLAQLCVEPYLWGADAEVLLKHLEGEEKGFDTLILSDLLFNHSEHDKLVETVSRTLKRRKDARALVFFTPHRPWLYENDLDFFKKVEEVGIVVEKVVEEVLEKPMFEEDRGVSEFPGLGRN